MVLIDPLGEYKINNCSDEPKFHQNLEMVALKKINPIVLSAPLVDYKINNCSETPNCHQNIEIIALKKN